MWFYFELVALPCGDSIGVTVRWKPTAVMDGVTADHLTGAQHRIAEGSWRQDVQAHDWAGKVIADGLGLDLVDKARKKRVSALSKKWIGQRALNVETRNDSNRKPKTFIVVGRPIMSNPSEIMDFSPGSVSFG